MTPLLSVSDLAVSYGAVPAVQGVGLEIFPGEVRVILGANGAGKTTIIKSLFGLLRPRQGVARYAGEHDLLRLKPHQIRRLGLAWVQRWTNDRWPSTLHRVVNPAAGDRPVSRRMSIGFFVHPNYDAVIAGVPMCRRRAAGAVQARNGRRNDARPDGSASRLAGRR
jgi:ABC-type phosphonate transport system ATPase subunit